MPRHCVPPRTGICRPKTAGGDPGSFVLLSGLRRHHIGSVQPGNLAGQLQVSRHPWRYGLVASPTME
jgi:hypothetical protein